MRKGAVIKTSYGTGPYIIVNVHQADDGSLSLTLNATHPEAGKKKFWINGVRLVDGHWMAYARDEIFIIQDAPDELVQLRLF